MDTPDALARLSRLAPDLRGKTTIGWRLMHWLDGQQRLVGTWQLTLGDGTRFELPRKSPMAWTTAFRGSYDSATREIVMRHIVPDTLVFDVGASLGLWTVPLAQHASTIRARVWAFEPHPNNHAWLHGNLRRNDLEAVVTVHEIALGDETGTATMDVGEAGLPGSGGNSAIASGDCPSGVSVPIATLDSIPRPARVSVIKLDVEGFEVRALRGAARLIAEDRPVIFGEFNQIWLRERGEEVGAFLDDIRSDGYEVFTIENLRTRPWRARDCARVRLLGPGQVGEDLLLRPVGA